MTPLSLRYVSSWALGEQCSVAVEGTRSYRMLAMRCDETNPEDCSVTSMFATLRTGLSRVSLGGAAELPEVESEPEVPLAVQVSDQPRTPTRSGVADSTPRHPWSPPSRPVHTRSFSLSSSTTQRSKVTDAKTLSHLFLNRLSHSPRVSPSCSHHLSLSASHTNGTRNRIRCRTPSIASAAATSASGT